MAENTFVNSLGMQGQADSQQFVNLLGLLFDQFNLEGSIVVDWFGSLQVHKDV